MVISAKITLAVVALALIGPTPALAAEIREQPTDTVRTDITRVEWTGESAGQVFVERRHGLNWVTEASNLSPQPEGENAWSVRWQPGRSTPTGTYRVRIETAGETLLANEFELRPCECVIPGRLRARWRGDLFRLRLTAEYAPAGTGEFRLRPAPVQTGRPVVRVLLKGRRIGSVRLRYRRGKFRGTWVGPREPQDAVVFRLVSLTDGFGNS